ncbi:MAG: nucleotide exchange factor GrpE [Acholeplasmatales bacterium]|nr:nucleotide exchange factor GrpE [Acholeplasmatales bacterium]
MAKEEKDTEIKEEENIATDAPKAEETPKAEKKETKKEKKSKEQEKIEKLEEEIRKLKEDNAKLKNDYLKAYADSQNFQKRINDQAIKDRKYASQNVIGELINPIDMLVQIVNMPAPSPEIQNYVIGFQMITNQLTDILKNEGLAPIEVKVGVEFDPKTMQAVETSNLDDVDDNKVTKVMQSGYMYKDRILRPAMVVVNKKPKEEAKENNGKEEE